MTVDAEKIKHWLSQGAHLSETANNLLINKGIIEGDKVQVWKPKKKKIGEVMAQEKKPVEANAEPQVEIKEKAKEEPKPEKPAPAPVEAPAV